MPPARVREGGGGLRRSPLLRFFSGSHIKRAADGRQMTTHSTSTAEGKAVSKYAGRVAPANTAPVCAFAGAHSLCSGISVLFPARPCL